MKVELPRIPFGPVQISRLILGGNPLRGRPLIAMVKDWVVEYVLVDLEEPSARDIAAPWREPELLGVAADFRRMFGCGGLK